MTNLRDLAPIPVGEHVTVSHGTQSRSDKARLTELERAYNALLAAVQEQPACSCASCRCPWCREWRKQP